ncbi:mucosal addressin cell adhesion molecule 1 [Microcaecilia unicolor]|uniref:Mucosal addressin cell adhesion molecule 1 n=1 Tax=Microcaecilia unicolor TaxID=1415580 RepID=A0A6P7ZG08_9AMPH|nr:mucosal addressin cell adhesion molecule 1 [Microcaecilia unicolor]
MGSGYPLGMDKNQYKLLTPLSQQKEREGLAVGMRKGSALLLFTITLGCQGLAAARESLLTIMPSKPLVQLGSSIHLNCSITCSSGKVLWKGLDTNLGSTFSISQYSVLSIPKATVFHEGTKICIGQCQRHSTLSTIYLQVYSFPDEVELVFHPEGSLVQQPFLSCAVSQVYPPSALTLSWYQGDEKLQVTTLKETEDEEEDLYKYETRLELPPGMPMEGTMYRCEAHLNLGQTVLYRNKTLTFRKELGYNYNSTIAADIAKTNLETATAKHITAEGNSTTESVTTEGNSTTELATAEENSTTKLVTAEENSTTESIAAKINSTIKSVAAAEESSTTESVTAEGNSATESVTVEENSTTKLFTAEENSTTQSITAEINSITKSVAAAERNSTTESLTAEGNLATESVTAKGNSTTESITRAEPITTKGSLTTESVPADSIPTKIIPKNTESIMIWAVVSTIALTSAVIFLELWRRLGPKGKKTQSFKVTKP